MVSAYQRVSACRDPRDPRGGQIGRLYLFIRQLADSLALTFMLKFSCFDHPFWRPLVPVPSSAKPSPATPTRAPASSSTTERHAAGRHYTSVCSMQAGSSVRLSGLKHLCQCCRRRLPRCDGRTTSSRAVHNRDEGERYAIHGAVASKARPVPIGSVFHLGIMHF